MVLLAPLFAAALLGLVTPLAASAADLALTIAGARSAEGVVAICLWQDAKAYPDCGASRTAIRRTVPPGALGRPIVFEDVRPGTVAVSALHDENGNGRLDTGLFGIPKEGIAVSNDALPRFSAPTFAPTAFRLAGDAKRTITLLYR